jgi:hypothetical protein
MERETGFTSPLRLLTENPGAVLERLRQGEIEYLGEASDRFVDLHLLYALQSGLIDECARAFPDPRWDPEIPPRVLLTAAVAGVLAGEYALCQAAPALHSPAVLAELGLNVQWLAPGEGLSRRGTQAKALFHSDTLRKLLSQIAQADQAAGRFPGASLIDWWNQTVGEACLRRAGGGTGAWILDCTKLLVNLENPRYEGSDISQDDKGRPLRGYKLALLSALVDEGRVIGRVGWDSVRAGDLPVARPLLQGQTPFAAGDTLLEDRGLIDGPTITCLKRDLGVDVVFGLKKDMLSFRLAVAQASLRPAAQWQPSPTRPRQALTLVQGIGGVWEGLDVPIHGCVVREPDAQEPDGYAYWVFGTTNLARTAAGIIQDYEARSECEEDHRQTKGRDWELDEFTSTSLVEILFHVLGVLLAYNLCQMYGQTTAGQRFAGKTKRARLRAVQRERVAWLVVIAPPYYAVLEELDVAEVLLEVEGEAKARLRAVIQRLKAARKPAKRAVGAGISASQVAW